MIISLLRSHLLFGIISALLFVCGLIAVGNLLSPEAVQQIVPNWQARFGAVVALGVVLGFIRSAYRLIVPICALVFWGVALGAVLGGPLSSYIPDSQSIQQTTQAELGKVEELLRHLPIPERLKHLLR
jgi:hypothetical protein